MKSITIPLDLQFYARHPTGCRCVGVITQPIFGPCHKEAAACSVKICFRQLCRSPQSLTQVSDWGLNERYPVFHRWPAVGWPNSFPTNLSQQRRVMRPYGFIPSVPALCKNAFAFLSCNSNYFRSSALLATLFPL